MNEMMLALEAMIRRVVQEEFTLSTAPPAAFAARMQDTMRMFPDDFTILLNELSPAPVLGTDYDQAGFKAAFLKTLSEDSHELNLYIRDTVTEDSYIHDHIVEVAHAAQADDLRTRVEDIVGNMDFSVSVS